MRSGHYTFIIGSLTLDVYQTHESGVIYLLDATHGYHKSSLHLATRFPRKAADGSDPFSVFPWKLWAVIFFSLTLIVLTIFNIWLTYSKIIGGGLIKENLDVTQIILRLTFGFTEPDDEGWFKGFSTGRFTMSLWFLSSFFIVSIYCVDLRARIIVPEMETPINDLDDIDFAKMKIILDYEEGTKLSYSDQALLSNFVPGYKTLNAKSLTVST